MNIIINEFGDYNVVINLNSNASISGTYIDANEANISKLEQIVSASDINHMNKLEPVSNLKKYVSVKFGDNKPNIPSSILPLYSNIQTISNNNTYNELKTYFESSDYFVTGTTNSKYNTIITSYIEPTINSIVETKVGVYNKVATPTVTKLNKNVSIINGRNTNLLDQTHKEIVLPEPSPLTRLNKKILIHGTDIYAMILSEGTIIEYVLYVGTQYPIKYIDFPDGKTIFKYKRSPDYNQTKANIVLYNRLIDEPKILSEVFIDRGVNNAFEPVKRLKNVDNLKELSKIGLGYYKINTTGVNFKQI